MVSEKFIGAAAFAKAEGLLKSETRQLARSAVFGVAAVLLLVSIPSEVNRVFNATKGLGYSSPKWRNSETLRRADVLPEGADVYTNFPELFYLHHNQKSVSFTPFLTDSAFARYFHWDVEWWRKKISHSNRPKFIVWFEGRRGGDMLTPDAISKIVPLELLEEYRDGAIYRVVTAARQRD